LIGISAELKVPSSIPTASLAILERTVMLEGGTKATLVAEGIHDTAFLLSFIQFGRIGGIVLAGSSCRAFEFGPFAGFAGIGGRGCLLGVFADQFDFRPLGVGIQDETL